jgi:hypothetical protein
MPDAPAGCISYVRGMTNNHRPALIRDPPVTVLLPAGIQIACHFDDVSEYCVQRKVT